MHTLLEIYLIFNALSDVIICRLLLVACCLLLAVFSLFNFVGLRFVLIIFDIKAIGLGLATAIVSHAGISITGDSTNAYERPGVAIDCLGEIILAQDLLAISISCLVYSSWCL